MSNTTLTAKDKFNALSNADHIFAFAEEKIPFKLLEIVNAEGSFKAIVQLTDGSIKGMFSDSPSAKNALHEVLAVFDNEQPVIKVLTKKTGKDKTIYYVEIQD